jgi:hypothetical protein
MLANFSFIFDCPIIHKTVECIVPLINNFQHVLGLTTGSLITDWSVENINTDMSP